MNVVAPTARSGPAAAHDELRVMVVDDALVVRSLLSRWIDAAPGLRVVATLRNGREALERLEAAKPDVVVLDVEMPELDGISTLPRLLELRRDLVVIMASALTRENAEVTLKALALGAADYIPKPANEGGVMTSATFQRELIEKIRALGARPRKQPVLPPYARPAPATRRLASAVQRVGKWRVAPPEPQPDRFKLRPFPAVTPRVLLIGSSTGGPQALTKLMSRLDAVSELAPILITQHMPATFTTILAEHLTRAGAKQVHEAVHGEPVLAGKVYLAPGGKHMRVARQDGTAVIVLDDGPPVNFCKPAVDPLFSSAAEVWGPWNMALILTGMGSDGTSGAGEIVAAGGSVIAQDEATSVIWGMPGSAVDGRRVLGRAAAGPDRPKGRPHVPGGHTVSQHDYEYLRRLLKARSGLVLSADKHYLIESRLLPLARKAGLFNLTGLVGRLKGPDAEELIVEVVEAMTTNESFFFRDKVPFEHFRETVMPALLAARAASRRIRIWCAAASTGQEPYSLALCLKEMGKDLRGWRVEIVATDLSTEVLEKAKSGIYSQFEVQRGLPVLILIKYFSQVGEMWQIAPEIRGMVKYLPLNLLHEFSSLGRFDVVFCRNVLIYFDQATKIDVLERIADVTERDGFLVLGGAETVVGLTDRFRPVADRRGLYAPPPVSSGNVVSMKGASFATAARRS